MKPGDKVKILIDTWFAPAGVNGVIANINLTEGLISVHYFDKDGIIFDFDKTNLRYLDEKNV